MEEKILKKMGISPTNNEAFSILTSSLRILTDQYKNNLFSLQKESIPVLEILKNLNSDEIDFINSKLSENNLSIEECQLQVQKLIPQQERKKFAAYYTIDRGSMFMASMVEKYLENKSKKDDLVIVDPFMGSGMAVTDTLKTIGPRNIKKVWGVEPLPLPALVAYTALLVALEGKKELIEVIVGDAFNIVLDNFSGLNKVKLPKPDVILTNPPFTRWKYLEKEYRDFLLELILDWGYEKYITRKEISLQTLCMYLCDYIIEDNGLIISVLPVSTFYTIYGKGYKWLLKSGYETLGILESSSRSSFSEDSGFKEVILAVIKGSEGSLTAFSELNDNSKELSEFLLGNQKDLINYYSNDLFDINNLPRFLDINWLSLFGNRDLRNFLVEIFTEGFENGTLEYWEDALGSKSIIRGVEMYGPEFFFIPNKYWKVIDETSNIFKISNLDTKEVLEIEKKFFTKTFRKPSLYDRMIETPLKSSMLSIPPEELSELPEDLQKYIKWGISSETAQPSIKSYGKYWYSHVHKQMVTKKPFGHIIIPDKVDLGFKRRGVFANYTKKKAAASKNFYVVKDKDEKVSKVLATWFNSTLFISIFILLGRKISNSWTRLLRNDYLEIPLINVENIDQSKILDLCEIFDEISGKNLDPFWDQLEEPLRFKLDVSLFKALNIRNPEEKVKKMYKILKNSNN